MVNFNNSQRLGLDVDKHIALDAGAGTGKTTVMAERYVQHLLATEQRATHLTPPGPRVPLVGHGSLRAPKRERTDAANVYFHKSSGALRKLPLEPLSY